MKNLIEKITENKMKIIGLIIIAGGFLFFNSNNDEDTLEVSIQKVVRKVLSYYLIQSFLQKVQP